LDFNIDKNFAGRFMTLALISGLLTGSLVGVMIERNLLTTQLIDNVAPYPVR